jgi:MYXO-CTERM domain-containing protein
VAWVSDPGQGGPADNVLEVRINVIAAADLGGAGRDGSSDGGDGGAPGDGGSSALGDGASSAPGDGAGDPGNVHGKLPSHGCGCGVGAAASDTDGSGLAVLLIVVAAAARRTSKWLLRALRYRLGRPVDARRLMFAAAASLAMAMLVGCAPAPKLIIGSTVALYSPEHKRFVRMNANGFVDAADPVSGPEALPASWLWERFLIVDGGGGTVALYNERNRRFIRINTLGDADSAFPVDRLPASWTRERFTPVDAGWGTIAFYNRASHRFLRMKPDGVCDSAHPVSGPESLPYDWTWERFRIIQVARIASVDHNVAINVKSRSRIDLPGPVAIAK